jgi:hypothetical protein
VGVAYRLTPDGTTFTTPATLTIAYSPDDLLGSSVEALSVGYQGTDGRWRTMKTPTVDGVAQTVSAPIKHFSDWSQLMGWQLRPPEGRVAPLGTLALQLRYCEPEQFDELDLAGLTPRCDIDDELPHLVTVNGWFVNGQRGGSLGTGFATGTGVFGTYQAPGAPPPSNPVAVSVEFNRNGGRGRQQAVSNVTVTEAGWTGTISW